MDVRVKGQIALMEYLPSSSDAYMLDELISEKVNNESELYLRYVYNVIAMIIKGSTIDSINMTIQQGRLGWNDFCYDEARAEVQEHDDFLENPFTVEEGALVCSCGSNRVFSYQKQTRSCDEPATTFACCTKCRRKWVYNG